MKKEIALISLLALASVTLSSCAPIGLAAGAGAAVGVAAAQEGGLRGAITDDAIKLQITDMWVRQGVDFYRRLDMTVKEGRVLITGVVPTADMRVDAVRLAWQAEGVKQVINEVRVEEGGGVSGYATDTWVTGNIKTQLLLDKYIQSINYSIETVKGTVYIMGIAQDRKELDRVFDIARNSKFVKNVVSYARLRGEVPNGLQEPTVNQIRPSNAPASRAPTVENNTYSSAPTSSYNDTSVSVAPLSPAPVEKVPLNAPK